MTGLLMVRRENPLQSRRSQGYLIATAHRLSSRPGGPDPGLDLSAPPRLAASAGPGARFPPAAPAGLQLAGGLAHGLWRPGQLAGAGPTWPGPSGLPAVSPSAVGRLVGHEDAAVVGRRASPAGLASAPGWPPLAGRRQDAHRQTGLQAPGSPQNAAPPGSSFRLRLSDRPPHGPVGWLSHPG